MAFRNKGNDDLLREMMPFGHNEHVDDQEDAGNGILAMLTTLQNKTCIELPCIVERRLLNDTPTQEQTSEVKILDEYDLIRLADEISGLDPSSVFNPESLITFKDSLPEDAIFHVFLFLDLRSLVKVGQVCKLWYRLHKHNAFWKNFLMEKNGSLDYEPPRELVKEYVRKYKRQKKSFKQKSWNQHARKVTYEMFDDQVPSKQKDENHAHFRTFRRMMRDRKRLRKLKKRQGKREKLRKHYESFFRTPQRVLRIFYISIYTPFFFLMSLLATATYSLWLDDIVSRKSEWWLLMIFCPILLCGILYLLAMTAAITADLLRVFRRNTKFNSNLSMIYMGNTWLPIMTFLVFLKVYILPQSTPWRVAFAPAWVFESVYTVTALILHQKIDFLKWGYDQKVIYGITALVNIVIVITSAFLATHLDRAVSVSFSYVYCGFVFTPIWALLVLGLIGVPLFAYFSWLSNGLWFTLLVFVPFGTLFVVPWIPFFIMLALKLDGFVQWPYTAIFSPLIVWELIWSLVSSVGGVGYFVFTAQRSCKR